MKHLPFFLAVFFLLANALPVSARTGSDPYAREQWYLEKIGAPKAWDSATGTHDVVVAVLDTGVDLDHPDLAANIWTNESEVEGDGLDNDHNGFIDDRHGWDFIEGDNTPTPDNELSVFTEEGVIHGTAVASLIGAVGDNGEGIAGVNWKVKVMPVRILDNTGSGDSDAARQAIDYAIDNGADIINLSFTGFEMDDAFRAAIDRAAAKDVLIVAAVGNKGGGGLNVDEKPIYPACYANKDGKDIVIGVAASTKDDLKATFSNYGANCTEISAPGQDMFVALYQDPTWADFRDAYRGGWAGTSLATPLVSGAAALLKSAYPQLSALQIKTVLQLSVDAMKEDGPAAGKLGAGRLNVGRALEVAKGFAAAAFVASSAPSPFEQETPATPRLTAAQSHQISWIALGAPKGEKPWVKLYSPSGFFEKEFLAYGESFRGGVRVAYVDLDGDGKREVLTAPGPGGGPHVRIFHRDGTLMGQFFAFEGSSRTGLSLTTADVNGDGEREVVVAEDQGGRSRIGVYSLSGTRLEEFTFAPKSHVGVRVAAADVDGDGATEIIAAAATGAPLVKVFSGSGEPQGEFLAYDAAFHQGVSVSAGDLNADGKAEIVVGPEPGGGPHVRAFDAQGNVVASFFAYDEASRSGVRVSVTRDGSGPVIAALQSSGRQAILRLFTKEGTLLSEYAVGEGLSGTAGASIAGSP